MLNSQNSLRVKNDFRVEIFEIRVEILYKHTNFFHTHLGKPLTGADGTSQWYSEIKDFDFNNKVFDHKTGHFTQVVWKDCKEMGAGGSSTKDGWNFVVARYSPSGNMKGKFEENIGVLKDDAEKK